MRINFYGGPHTGKSTVAPHIFSALKKEGQNLELVIEHVKSWVAMKREIKSFDQVFLFAKQMNDETVWLNNGTEHIVTDSPVMLAAIYYLYYESIPSVYESLIEILREYEYAFPSINIILRREDVPFNPSLRLQDEMQSRELDILIEEEVEKFYGKGNCEIFDWDDYSGILKYIREKLLLSDLKAAKTFNPEDYEQSK